MRIIVCGNRDWTDVSIVERLHFVPERRPSGDAPNALRLSPAQKRINARGARAVLNALLGLPDAPDALADERQALLATLLRRATRKASGPAECATVLEIRGMKKEAAEVRRFGGCGHFGIDRLRAAARRAALLDAAGAMRARALRWAAERCA